MDFILDEIYIENEHVFIVAFDDSYKIEFPDETFSLLKGEWVWEIYFDGKFYEDIKIYKKDTFYTIISQFAVDDNNWKVGDELTWEVKESENGPEIFVTKLKNI